MCYYLQSEQCHSIDLVNLLITSRKMFLFFFLILLELLLDICMLKSEFTATVEILKCIRNCINSAINPIFLLLTRANGYLQLQIVRLKNVKKLYLGMVTNSTMKQQLIIIVDSSQQSHVCFEGYQIQKLSENCYCAKFVQTVHFFKH